MPSDLRILGPGSGEAAVTNTFNQNMKKIMAEDVTKTWKNETGELQMMFGKLPNGSYGMLFYLNELPHIIITASTGMVTAEEGTSVLDVI